MNYCLIRSDTIPAGRNVAYALGLVAAIKLGQFVESRADRGDAEGEVAEARLRAAGLYKEEP